MNQVHIVHLQVMGRCHKDRVELYDEELVLKMQCSQVSFDGKVSTKSGKSHSMAKYLQNQGSLI